MKLLETILIIIAVGIFLYIYKDYLKGLFSRRATMVKENNQANQVIENIEQRNIIGKIKFKLVSYKEALEASREFIYNIARTVMQKFSSQDKDTVLNLGTRLMNAGVEYIHVVDVFKISLDKQKHRAQEIKKEKDKTRSQQK